MSHAGRRRRDGGELAELLRRRAGSDRRGTALVDVRADGTDHRLTWSDLDAATEALASRLGAMALDGPIVACFPGADVASAVVNAVGALRAGVPFFPMPRTNADATVRLLALASQVGRAVDPTCRILHDADPNGPGPAGPGCRPVTLLLATSGTSGPPNLIGHTFDLARVEGGGFSLLFDRAGWTPSQRQLATLPCSHIAPILSAVRGVVDGNTVVSARPEEHSPLELAAEYGIDWMLTTPHHMTQALRRSIPTPAHPPSVLHTGSGCPVTTKRAWLELIGPDRLFEMYGGTEAPGMTFVDGRTWLRLPGTVGKGFLTRVSIRDPHGTELPGGELGEIHLKTLRRSVELGPGRLRRSPDGFTSLGDCGWLDGDGHLFVRGRAADRIENGASSTWPAELAAALMADLTLVDVAVDLGRHPGRPSVTVTAVPADPDRPPTRTEFQNLISTATGGHVALGAVHLVTAIERSPMGKRPHFSSP
jgi:bile acid-coenzyme A ligase